MNISTSVFLDTKTQHLNFTAFKFAGGELHVRLLDSQQILTQIQLFTRLTDSDAIMQLLMTVDALKRQYGTKLVVDLTIPYFPYARQDRVCVTGEAFGAAVMANLINNLNCRQVTVFDAHSNVVTNQLNNVINISQAQLIALDAELSQKIRNNDLVLVSPDKGAQLKTRQVAEHFGKKQVIQCNKIRDSVTGNITDIQVYGEVKGKDLLIVDDICDGGKTFIKLGERLQQQGANRLQLYVTHGIFSQGLAVFKGIFDTIYTTDAFSDGLNIPVPAGLTLKIINSCEQLSDLIPS